MMLTLHITVARRRTIDACGSVRHFSDRQCTFADYFPGQQRPRCRRLEPWRLHAPIQMTSSSPYRVVIHRGWRHVRQMDDGRRQTSSYYLELSGDSQLRPVTSVNPYAQNALGAGHLQSTSNFTADLPAFQTVPSDAPTRKHVTLTMTF